MEISLTPEAAARLRALFAAGQLRDLGGVPVLELDGAPQPQGDDDDDG